MQLVGEEAKYNIVLFNPLEIRGGGDIEIPYIGFFLQQHI